MQRNNKQGSGLLRQRARVCGATLLLLSDSPLFHDSGQRGSVVWVLK